tara:strand:- start:892 stop:1377 length:486 start_codon:yes stop_codon:yes gene_type:complete
LIQFTHKENLKMKSTTIKMLCRSTFAVLALAAIGACSSGNGGFPQIANPPPFDFVDGAQLRSRMHQLAFEVQRLDIALMAGEENNNFTQDAIVESLRNIERLAGVIREEELSVRHTFLQDDMARFISTVSRARMSAESSSPRYSEASRVTGACVNCHQINS